MSSTNLETTKSLLHFDELLKDEIGLETWSTEKTNVVSGDITKFGHGSLYPYGGALLGTNNSGIWNLNSSENYEIEFFIYPVKHGGTRYLFRLMENGNSSPILLLSLTTGGYLELTTSGWEITSAITSSTALTINTWHHMLIRVSNQTLKVFLDGTEEISADLPENITLAIVQVRLGYFNSTTYKYYIDEFIFRHSANNNIPTIPNSPYFVKSSFEHIFKNTKSLLHFDDLLRDEIYVETWSKENANVVSGDIVKFGHGSLYSNGGALLGTNNSGIWNLKSNGNYEIEFFVYPVKHGGTRYLFRLYNGSSILLNLSLNSNGTINFLCNNLGCSSVNGTTVLAVNEWHHIMLRISNQTAKIFINGAEEIIIALSENKSLIPTQARIGYFSAIAYAYYIDEFLFRHSTSTETPTVPTSPYSFCAYRSHTKRNFGTIKSLLHFDYPYFNEPNDGLGDEIGFETWTKSSTNVKLYGSAIPKAGTLAPKFGYRCLYTLNAYAYCNNESGIWNLASQGKYEIGMFVYITQTANDKSIFSLMDTEKTNAIFKLSSSAGGLLSFVSSGFGIETISGTTAIAINTWHHIFMRISDRRINIYLDGNLEISSELSSGTEIAVGQVRMGNDTTSYPVYVDEFMFRHSADKDAPTVPTEPYNGYLSGKSIGGYGNGSNGNAIINTKNTQINSYGIINLVINSKIFNVASWNNGTVVPDVGNEIMIHITAPKSTSVADYPLVGLYGFAKIIAVNGVSIVLNRNITTSNGYDFTLSNELLSAYYVQAIAVPNYKNLTINSGCTVNPLTWTNTTGGGIVVFRCLGNCTINGNILTMGYGVIRYDMIQMTHSQMVDRFMITRGGGIYLTCGGTLRISENARLGASWSGLGQDYNGAAGYGGSGLIISKVISGGVGGGSGGRGGQWNTYSSVSYIGDTYVTTGGSVGGSGSSGKTFGAGGGGGCGGNGGNATGVGSTSNGNNIAGAGGGCQGEVGGHAGLFTVSNSSYGANGNPSYGCNGGHGKLGKDFTNGTYSMGGAGGGGAGGNGGNPAKGAGGCAGSCIVIVSRKASISEASISTGGQRGTYHPTKCNEGSTAGAGGTGFCYIAAEDFIDE